MGLFGGNKLICPLENHRNRRQNVFLISFVAHVVYPKNNSNNSFKTTNRIFQNFLYILTKILCKKWVKCGGSNDLKWTSKFSWLLFITFVHRKKRGAKISNKLHFCHTQPQVPNLIHHLKHLRAWRRSPLAGGLLWMGNTRPECFFKGSQIFRQKIRGLKSNI